MTKTEIFHKINTTFLLLWYVISIPIIYCDKTITGGLLIAFELVSILMICMTVRILRFSYNNPSRMDILINSILFFWFVFVTHRDMETNYDLITKILYVSIDFCSTLFLFDNFLGFLLETSFFKHCAKKINSRYRCLLSLICALSFLIYCKYTRICIQ